MNKKYFTIIITTICSWAFSQNSVLYKDEFQKQWVDSVYSRLSLEEKVGQLFIVAAYSNKDTAHETAILHLVKNQHIGGLIFMQDNAQKQLELTRWYQSNTRVPLLIGMDAEWDLSMRLKNTHKFPFAMTLGAIQDNSLIYNMAQKIAEHCNVLGVHWNFAPVVDVNTNPLNPIIGNRSFGSDVDNVSRKGSMYSKGLQSLFVLSSAKHFPGHGDTSSDSHKTLPLVNHSVDRLNKIELAPFQNLINNGVSGIMVAHLDVPSLEPNNIPSSLSYKIITDKLKNDMGFKGLIITDALNMQGVASRYAPGIVDVKAFEAGNDILLFSQNVEIAQSEILKKINSGEIPLSRLEESVKKILAAKYFVGLSHPPVLSDSNLYERLVDSASLALKQRLYENAITLVKTDGAVPFSSNTTQYFIPLGQDYNIFQRELEHSLHTITASASQNLKNQKIILGVFKSTSSPYAHYKLTESEINTIHQLAENNKVTLVLFTSPYALSSLNISSIENIIVAYENNEYTQKATAQILDGSLPPKGKLPVEISRNLPYGLGIVWGNNTGLIKTNPENEGLNSLKLNQIDAIAQGAIAQHETPGMQILIARNGKIVYEKCFGYLDYSQAQAVEPSTLYDLASVSKVLGTLPFVMKMYEEGSLSLDSPIGTFFPYAQNTDKAYITFREILLHNSGLKSWIPFYKETLDEYNQLDTQYYRKIICAQFYNPVAQNIFSNYLIRKKIYESIANSQLQPKTYDYSDLGFYILQYVIENYYHTPLNVLVEKFIANPLNAHSLTYRPLEKFPQYSIAPSEIDNYFRMQTLQGHVQDQGAGLMGGVSGHAGLFGNAEDVAKELQLFLNGGSYNNYRLLKPETIQYFSGMHYNSRRGLGFDKQKGNEGPFFENATTSGFGHTGYTGTMVWVDPSHQLLFVFLSNRSYPDASVNKLNAHKTRQKILKLVYDSMQS